MNYRLYCVLSGSLFGVVGVAHLLRIFFAIPVQVDTYDVPMLFSWLGFLIPAVLSAWAFRLSRDANTPAPR